MTVAEVGTQAPRIMLTPEYGSSAGAEAVELAELAGLKLDPWQELVLEHSLGELPDGRWAAAEVGLCVPRQNGKNSVLEVRELAGLFLLGEELLIHSAQQFKTAKEHFLRILSLIENTPDLSRRVKKVTRTHGEEGIELVSGQRLLFFARTKSSGRGFAKAGFIAFDEAMFLPESTLGALVFTQGVTDTRQRWYVGSAVDQSIHIEGRHFARVRERGINGTDDRLVWCEWSVEADTPTEVPDEWFSDPEAWAIANPALGIRLSEEVIGDELRAVDRRTFAVERLGVGDWPDTEGTGDAIIPAELWDAIHDPDGVVADPVSFAIDVSPERATSIAVCGKNQDGNRQVEIVDHRAGTGWVVDRIVALDEKHSPTLVVCDGYGPAGSLVPALTEAGVKVTTLNSVEHGQACGLFIDAVQQETVRHLGSLELRNAVKGAAARALGDAWAFSRKNSAVDISPLVAATFAHWASVTSDTGGDWTIY